MILPGYLIVFTYFASFKGYEDDIYEVISNLQVLRCKFGGKMDQFGGKSFLKLNSVEFMKLFFSKSVQGQRFIGHPAQQIYWM